MSNHLYPTLTDAQIGHILLAVARIINPDTWTQCAMFETEDGKTTIDGVDAVKWCATGALEKVAGEARAEWLVERLESRGIIRQHTGFDTLIEYNDAPDTSDEHIRKLFRTIAAAITPSPYPAGHPCAGEPTHTHTTAADTMRCNALAESIRNGHTPPADLAPHQAAFPWVSGHQVGAPVLLSLPA